MISRFGDLADWLIADGICSYVQTERVSEHQRIRTSE
jgi:hypothetical protein